MEIVAEGGSYVLNSTTGYADEVLTRNHTAELSTSIYRVAVYSFLLEDEAKMEFTFTAFDSNEQVLASHHFTDVPMKINQLTRYTGNFFTPETSEGGFSVELAHDFDWENEEAYTFNFSD